MPPPLIVLDTMVVVAAIIGRSEGASALALRAVATGEARLAISDDFLSELVRVLCYPHIEEKILRPVRAFEAALDLGTMGVMFHPRRLEWPSLRDRSDFWVLDLAYEATADYIVTQDEIIQQDAPELGFLVISPEQFLEFLRDPDLR